MINPNVELFRWGPIPGKPLYVSYFMVSIAESFAQKYTYAWPEVFFYFKGEYMTFICEYTPLRASGKNHMKRWILDDAQFEKIKKEYGVRLKLLHEAHQAVEKSPLKALPQWQEAYLSFWGPAMVPELANWGGEQWLKEELRKVIPDESEFIVGMEKLTAPVYLSFYQEEELELLKLKLLEKSPRFKTLLQEHTQKYCWIQNSYFETKVLSTTYFKHKLQELQGKDIAAEIKKISSLPTQAREQKQHIFKKYTVSKDLQKLAERLSYCIYWQDARKKEVFRAEHYLKLLLEEISRQKKVSVADLEYYWGRELEGILTGKMLSAPEIAQRKTKFLGHYDEKLHLITKSAEFDRLVNPFLTRKIDPNLKEIKGTVASVGKGIVQGKVKILLHPREWKKVQTGDILVAPMTSPEYIVAMRKAAAIITDEGGLTSHAAIVSRELGVPCIVGTSIATKVLKDNEVVEVNAALGIVRRK